MRVREDEILRSNGEKGIYGVVEKPDGAVILPIDGDRIWLVEQFRYTVQERALELPQGTWEREIEDPEELARGELMEEAGLNAARMTQLGTMWIAYGFTKQREHVFLATGLTPTPKKPDAEEHDLVAHCVPIADFERMMLDGTIRDECTLLPGGYICFGRRGRGEPRDLRTGHSASVPRVTRVTSQYAQFLNNQG